MPDNYTTAMYTVFGGPGLALPIPPSLVPPSNVPNRPAVDVSAPVLVYGAGSSSGQFFVQALSLAGFTDIFAVASSHRHEFLRSLGATQCFDYRTPDFVSHIRSTVALTKNGRFTIAMDPIATRRRGITRLVKRKSWWICRQTLELRPSFEVWICSALQTLIEIS